MPPSLMALFAALGALFGASGGGGGGDSSSSDATSSPDSAPSGSGSFITISSDPIDIPASYSASAAPVSLGWGGLSAEEQLIVELINRARLDPDAEADRLGVDLVGSVSSSPKEALAVIPELSAASEEHSEDMDDRNFFAHTNPDGQSPSDRAIEAGYGQGAGENLSVIGSSWTGYDKQERVETHHENLWGSSGHQKNMMNGNWNEIGVGNDYGTYKGLAGSSYITEMFGKTGEDYLTGVAFEDKDGDAFYDMGEGMGGVRVTAFKDGEKYETATWDSGGYTLALDSGTYTIIFEGGSLDEAYVTEVTMGNKNVKLDLIETTDGLQLASMNGGTLQSSLDTSAALAYEDPLLSDLLVDTGEPGWEDTPPPDDGLDEDEGAGFFA